MYHLVFKLTLTESTLRMLHWFWVEVLFRFRVTPRLNVKRSGSAAEALYIEEFFRLVFSQGLKNKIELKNYETRLLVRQVLGD